MIREEQWEIVFTNKAKKQTEKLTTPILSAFASIGKRLHEKGPSAGISWPNYSKLHGSKNEDKYHCHIVKGRPIYVCCWEIINKKIKIIEVYYVGTHENTPY